MRQNFHPVGVQLAAERRRAGLSQEALAARLGVTRQAVSNWEGGKSQPDLEMLKKIAAQLSIPIEYLIYGRPASRPVPGRLQSPVGRLCRGLAAAVYVVGLVLGIRLGSGAVQTGHDSVGFGFSLAQALPCWAAALVMGTVLLGLAEVIRLLERAGGRESDPAD